MRAMGAVALVSLLFAAGCTGPKYPTLPPSASPGRLRMCVLLSV